jgi:hypothetical protein
MEEVMTRPIGYRYVGNKNEMRVHDLDKEDKDPNACQIDEIIRAGHDVWFTPDTLGEAHRHGYEDCKYCLPASRR